MQTIVTESDLRNAILQLESRQADENILMKAQFLIAVESIKPINLIKSAFIEATESEDLQANFVNTSIGLSAGYVSKMLFQGISHGPLRKIIGTVIMFGIKNLVAQNPETVKTGGRIFFKIIRDLLGKDKNTHTNEARATTGV